MQAILVEFPTFSPSFGWLRAWSATTLLVFTLFYECAPRFDIGHSSERASSDVASTTMPLRPALKVQPLNLSDLDSCSAPFPFASSSRVLDSPRVHFPPTPILTSTALTHSPNAYDRAPIRVTPNTCALPERGARMYFVTDSNESLPPSPKECYFQPRPSAAPLHSMQAWSEGRHSPRPSTPLSRDPSNIPSPLLSDCSSSSESDVSEGAYGSPKTPSRLRHHHSSNSSPSYSDVSSHGYSDTRHSITIQSEEATMTTSFSLLLSPPGSPPPAKLKHKGGMKKKKVHLQADEVRRSSSRSLAYDCDVVNVPELEGCLGGF